MTNIEFLKISSIDNIAILLEEFWNNKDILESLYCKRCSEKHQGCPHMYHCPITDREIIIDWLQKECKVVTNNYD